MTKKPNLVFIMSDQQSHDMVGAYGLSSVRTPNIDALARDGILFNHAISNAPVCTPARSMLISGQHPWWNNCIDNDRRLLTDNGPSIAQVLGAAGYRNAYVGKWHLYGGDRDRPVPPGPDRHGFDDLFLSNNCHVNYDPQNSYFWDGDRKELFGKWEAEGQTDQAVEYLRGVNPENPFSLFVSYHPPHNHSGGDAERYSMFDAPEEFKSLYDPSEIDLRPTIPDNERKRLMVQGYLAMCSEVDYHVGRIVAALREKGLYDDTLIVYTSDHGETFGALSNHWHKSSPEDLSIRIPLVVKLPNSVNAGTRSDLLVGSLDMMPTLLSLLGATPPKECHGIDLAAAVLARRDDAVESVPLFFYSIPWRGVYTREWTYSVENIDRRPGVLGHPASDVGRTVLLRRFDTLYDHEDDPHQLFNLYGYKGRKGTLRYQDLSEEMHRLTVGWLEKFDDPFPDQVETARALGAREVRPVDVLNRRQRHAEGP